MTRELAIIIAAVAGAGLVIAATVMWWINRTPHVERAESGVLPLFGGVDYSGGATPAETGVMAGGTVRQQPRTPTPAPPMVAVDSAPFAPPPAAPPRAVPAPAAPAPAAPPPAAPAPAAPAPAAPAPAATVQAAPAAPVPPVESTSTIRTFTTGTSASAPAAEPMKASFAPAPPTVQSVPANSPVVSHGVPGTMVEGHLIRFSVPQEGTLQFLPGRLEIGAGMDSGREIRFVHVPGPQGTEVTFGRSDGELYRHIQLRDQTVSRSHARMRFVEGHWYLRNLSQTNPIVHNGQVLSNGDDHLLADGDRIEMGEVIFTFRSR